MRRATSCRPIRRTVRPAAFRSASAEAQGAFKVAVQHDPPAAPIAPGSRERKVANARSRPAHPRRGPCGRRRGSRSTLGPSHIAGTQAGADRRFGRHPCAQRSQGDRARARTACSTRSAQGSRSLSSATAARTAPPKRRAVSGHPLTVIELDVASKAEALRAADRFATAFPRVYLDADVLVSGTAIHAVLEHLSRPGALAARPPIVYDTSSSSWVVRRSTEPGPRSPP